MLTQPTQPIQHERGFGNYPMTTGSHKLPFHQKGGKLQGKCKTKNTDLGKGKPQNKGKGQGT